MAVSNFYENTTKEFSGVITHNGSNPDTTGDTITFICKTNKSDTDANAVIDQDAIGLGAGGTFSLKLTPTTTAQTVGDYFYELNWYKGTDIYVLESGTLTILDKVQDNV